METLTLIVLVAVILVSFGVLIGCTLSERMLDARETASGSTTLPEFATARA